MAEKISLDVRFTALDEVTDTTDSVNETLAYNNEYKRMLTRNERVYSCPCEVDINGDIYIGWVLLCKRDCNIQDIFVFGTELFSSDDIDCEIMCANSMGEETIKCAIERAAMEDTALMCRITELETRRKHSVRNYYTDEVCSLIANDISLARDIYWELQGMDLDLLRHGVSEIVGSEAKTAVANALIGTLMDTDKDSRYGHWITMLYLGECDMKEILETASKMVLNQGLE